MPGVALELDARGQAVIGKAPPAIAGLARPGVRSVGLGGDGRIVARPEHAAQAEPVALEACAQQLVAPGSATPTREASGSSIS